jgi:tetratricopeptide (TPR) repeat protein
MPESGIEQKKLCFVVQGFGEKTDFTDGRTLNLDASYQMIKEAVEEAGLQCLRADEIKHSGTIDKPMYEQILHADLVIADLSTYNVNAAYELGIRYGLRRYATIIVAEDKFKNPFDVSHIVIRTYEHLGKDIGMSEYRRFKKELTDAIIEIMAKKEEDSPVYTFLQNLNPPVEGDDAIKKAEVRAPVKDSPVTTFLQNVQPPVEADEIKIAEVPAPMAGVAEQPSDRSAKELLDQAIAAREKEDFALAKGLLQAVRQMRPNDDYVVQQLALVTYKGKKPDPKAALEEARTILEKLNPDSSNDPETLGLWGAVHKRLWDMTANRNNLDESIAAYERGFYLKQDYYNGINLAFLLNVRAVQEEQAGEKAEAIADFVLARRVRHEVLNICQKALEGGPKSDADKYWILATMWEATVGIEDEAAALKWGQQAEASKAEPWMRESTRTQIEKLRALLAVSPLTHLKP